jgi:hypothetical protein
MTAAKATLRRRRSTAGGVPRDVVAWFNGEPRRPEQSSVPWAVLAFPGWVLLPGWWRSFKSENPKAKPPARYEWLDDDADSRNHPSPLAMRYARAGAR